MVQGKIHVSPATVDQIFLKPKSASEVNIHTWDYLETKKQIYLTSILQQIRLKKDSTLQTTLKQFCREVWFTLRQAVLRWWSRRHARTSKICPGELRNNRWSLIWERTPILISRSTKVWDQNVAIYKYIYICIYVYAQNISIYMSSSGFNCTYTILINIDQYYILYNFCI